MSTLVNHSFLTFSLLVVCLSNTAEKATGPDLSEPDWESILEIVEDIKTKSVS